MLRHNAPLTRALRQTGEPASRAENDSLYPLVVAGDPAAIRRMIEGNTGLVVRKLRAFTRSRPKLEHLADDLLSAGFIELCKAVHRLAKTDAKKTNQNVSGYLSVCVNGAFLSFTDDQTSASYRTARSRRERGDKLPRPVQMPESFEPAYDASTVTELRQEIEACCQSDDELTIVRMREEGYTDREIGEATGKPTTTVFAARKAIEARFNKRQNTN